MYKVLASFTIGKQYKVGDKVSKDIFPTESILNFFLGNGSLELIKEPKKEKPDTETTKKVKVKK